MRHLAFLSVLAFFSLHASGQSFDACEDCELLFEGMPTEIGSSIQVTGPDEPGEPLFMEGIIYQPDGRTPAPGVVLYFYHTDATGRYSPAKEQKMALRHGHLRGWVKSDARGYYSFSTIRPGSYPNSKNPQHIHPIVVESKTRYYWIDEYLFTDDPLLSDEEKRRQPGRGGSGIISLAREGKGGWKGKRDIILGKGVPNYTAVKK